MLVTRLRRRIARHAAFQQRLCRGFTLPIGKNGGAAALLVRLGLGLLAPGDLPWYEPTEPRSGPEKMVGQVGDEHNDEAPSEEIPTYSDTSTIDEGEIIDYEPRSDGRRANAEARRSVTLPVIQKQHPAQDWANDASGTEDDGTFKAVVVGQPAPPTNFAADSSEVTPDPGKQQASAWEMSSAYGGKNEQPELTQSPLSVSGDERITEQKPLDEWGSLPEVGASGSSQLESSIWSPEVSSNNAISPASSEKQKKEDPIRKSRSGSGTEGVSGHEEHDQSTLPPKARSQGSPPQKLIERQVAEGNHDAAVARAGTITPNQTLIAQSECGQEGSNKNLAKGLAPLASVIQGRTSSRSITEVGMRHTARPEHVADPDDSRVVPQTNETRGIAGWPLGAELDKQEPRPQEYSEVSRASATDAERSAVAELGSQSGSRERLDPSSSGKPENASDDGRLAPSSYDNGPSDLFSVPGQSRAPFLKSNDCSPAAWLARLRSFEQSAQSAVSAEDRPNGQGADSESVPSPGPSESVDVEPVSLSEESRRFVRPLLGIEPGDVRISQGETADRITELYGADAVAIGEDIFIASRNVNDSPAALALIAHELVHVGRRQNRLFVPPIALGSAYIDTLPVGKDASDEEALARGVEAQVRELSQLPESRDTARIGYKRKLASPSAAESAVVPSAHSGMPRPTAFNQTDDDPGAWGGLPAPWEPLPPEIMSLSEAASTVPVSAGPMDSSTTSSDAEIAAAPVERSVDGLATPIATAEASASTQQPANPSTNLDQLARQVYSIVKRRLQAERRRLGD